MSLEAIADSNTKITVVQYLRWKLH